MSITLDFRVDDLPEAERPHAKVLAALLKDDLSSYIKTFSAAVALKENVGPLTIDPKNAAHHDMFVQWGFMACHEAALMAWHFGQTLKWARTNCLSRAPTLSSLADHDQVRALERLFGKLFPHHGRLRDAVAHMADMRRGEEAIERNALRGKNSTGAIAFNMGPNTRAGLKQALIQDTFAMGHKGEIVSLIVNAESVAKLQHVHGEALRVYGLIAAARAAPPASA